MGILEAQGCIILFILKKISYVLESPEAQSKGQQLLKEHCTCDFPIAFDSNQSCTAKL